MRVLMPFIGSRGDVQPGLALAHALSARGHQPVLGVPPNLVDFVRSTGVECQSLGPDSKALLDSDLVRHGIRQPHPLKRWQALCELASFGWSAVARDLDAAAPGADVIVTGLLAQEVAAAIAEKHDLPQAALHYCPVRRAESFNAAPVPYVSRSRGLNRASWAVAEGVWRAMTRRDEDRVRAQLGLGPSRGPLEERMTSRGALEIQVYDKIVYPELYAEWHPRRPFTGFLDLAPELHQLLSPALPDDVDSWLADGPPVVYFGFGSMPVADPAGAMQLISTASRRAGVRALVSSGWSDLPGIDSDPAIKVIGACRHAEVLPRCVAAVHHGGAGTTAAVLRAGIPSVVTWFSADQPMWGRQLSELGVGVSTNFRALNVDKLSAALQQVLTPSYRQRARSLDSLVGAQDAVDETVRLLEQLSDWAYYRRPAAPS